MLYSGPAHRPTPGAYTSLVLRPAHRGNAKQISCSPPHSPAHAELLTSLGFRHYATRYDWFSDWLAPDDLRAALLALDAAPLAFCTWHEGDEYALAAMGVPVLGSLGAERLRRNREQEARLSAFISGLVDDVTRLEGWS